MGRVDWQPPCTSPSSPGIACRCRTYGGTQRIVVYLARGLAAAGHRVTLIAGAGSDVPEATLVPLATWPRCARPSSTSGRVLPRGSTSCSSFAPAPPPPGRPLDPQPARQPAARASRPPNTLYLSRNHARRHGATAFVYNGIDLARVPLRAAPRPTTISSSAGSTRVKGHRWAIEGDAAQAAVGGWSSRADGGRTDPAGPLRGPGRRRAEGRAAGGRGVSLDAGAVGRAVRAHTDRGAGERHAGAGHRAARCPRSSRPRSAPLGDSLDELVALRERWTGSIPRRAGRGSSGTSPTTRWRRSTCGCSGSSWRRACCRPGRRALAERLARCASDRRRPHDGAQQRRRGGACRCARTARAAARRRPPAPPRRGRAAPRR